MNKRKCFAVLSSAALGVIVAAALNTSAHAAVKSYVINVSGKIISFDAGTLLTDYANKLSNMPSPMFDEYLKDAENLVL